MPSVFGVRPPAARRCVPSIAPRAVCRRMDSPDFPSTRRGGPGQDLDSLVAEELLDGFGYVRILAVDQLAIAFDDAHSAAETPERLGQLKAHVAAAEDDQVVGQDVQLQGLDVSQRACLREAGGIIDLAARAGVNDDGLAVQRPAPPALSATSMVSGRRIVRCPSRARRRSPDILPDASRPAPPPSSALRSPDRGHVHLPIAGDDPNSAPVRK